MTGYPPEIERLFDQDASWRALTDDDVLTMNRISEGLYLGNQRAAGIFFPWEEKEPALVERLRAEALASLREAGIRNIICCSEVDKRVFEAEGFRYECAMLSDGGDAEIEASTPAFSELLNRAVRLVAAARLRGEASLIHCQSGAHRSASIMCGVLMHERSATLADVLPLVLRARPFAKPTFWRHLLGVVEPQCLASTDSTHITATTADGMAAVKQGAM